jgi:hypothetical protein
MKRPAALLLALVASLALAGQALAAEEVRTDDAGREIRFDVRAEGVDVDWYADLLRRAPHADEISTVLVRIVDADELGSSCGRGAAGCYARNRLVVPAGRDRRTARVLLHEYGHHLDRGSGNAAAPEPNGTPLWWRARAMSELVAQQSVRRNYSRGWSRAISEIFAEDYAQIALGGPFRIEWLRPPDALVRTALLADLGLAAPPDLTSARPALRPVVIERRGTLTAGERLSVTFGLLGPGRRVTLQARANATSATGTSARLEIRCGTRIVTKALARRSTLDVRDLGPADCRASLVRRTSTPVHFSLSLRLSVQV